MPAGILVIAEQREGEIKAQSLQTLSKAASLAGAMGGDLSVVIIGKGVEGLVDAVKPYGPAKVYLADADHLADYYNASYADAAAAAAKAADPALILLSATALGKDLGPLVAARLNCATASDITAVEPEGDAVAIRKPIYAGKCYANFRSKGYPVVLSLRPNVFVNEGASAGGGANVEKLDVAASSADHSAVSYIEPETQELDVAEASIVVSGGRGLKEPDNFKYIRALADALGGAVGASRAVVDADWIHHKHQVGQTGKTVSPNLYVAVGISGAIQHLAGMSSSKNIVAINKDPDAPIFKVASFGLVGDLFSVIEPITDKIKAARGA